MPAVTSSIMRKRAAMPTSKPKKLGVMKLSEMDALAEKNAATGGSAAAPAGDHPATPSPTAPARKPAAAPSPPTPEQRPPLTSANLPKRNAQHLAPPKTMDMKDWDDWGVSSAFSAIGDVVSTFTSDPPSKSPGVVRFPRAPAAGAAPAHSGGTPSKATVEHFVAATSFEAVSMVGRAAMFLGNAVVDGIEGTAELVQNAAKKADRIAMNVASPDGTPRGHASRARGADAWGDFGDENANAPSHRSRGGVSVGGRVLSALSNLSPGSRRAHARGPASPPKRAAALAPRSPLRKNSPSRAARSRAAARASSAAVSSSAAAARGSEDDGEDWGWRAASPVKDEGELASAVRSAVAHLRRELDAANASEAELRATLASVRSELAEERATTESLKKQNLGLQRRQVQRDQEKDGSDPLAEQVRFQLEALVKEKAELARENDALWRENESLQELLMHSNMASMAEAMYSPGGALADLVPQPDFSEAEAETQKTEVNAAGEAPVQAKEAVDATEAKEVEVSEAKAEETVEVTETEAKAEEAVEVTEIEAKAEETVEVTEAKEVEVSETVEVTDAAAAPDAEMETRDAPAEEAEAAVAEAAVAEHPGDVSTPEAPAAAPEAPAAAPIVPAAQKQAKGGKKGKKGKRGKK